MQKAKSYLLLLAITLSSSPLSGGCAYSPLWPSLGYDDNLSDTPAHNAESKCLENQAQAKNCALNTITQLSAMLENVGQFKRGAAYALVATGTAAGGAIAFDASRDLLMGLALGVASILGLETVVNSDGQRAVLEAGRDATQCVYNATVQIENKAAELGARIETLGERFAESNFRRMAFDTGALRSSVNSGQLSESFRIAGQGITKAADDPAQDQLGAAVIRIRALVRDGLYDTIPALSELAKTQRTTVDAMIENFARQSENKAGAAQEALRNNQLSLARASTFRNELDENLNNLFALRSAEDQLMDTVKSSIDELSDIVNEQCQS